jgi:anti-sigma regulatory factor (Ser/Thr protein kinase)
MSCAVTDVHDLSLELPATVESARAARLAVDKLHYDEHGEAVFNLRLLVTELVGNSVRHAGLSSADTIIVEIQIESDRIRAQVTDRGPGFTRPVFDEPPSGTGGRGLYLVDALADSWGAEPNPEHDGWLVWFELDLE